MYKRMTVRLTKSLSEELKAIARERGISVNSLISEMAWSFVERWEWVAKNKSI